MKEEMRSCPNLQVCLVYRVGGAGRWQEALAHLAHLPFLCHLIYGSSSFIKYDILSMYCQP
jgi:hypothetical protein